MTFDQAQDFQQTILAYLDTAYNYAYWLTKNPHDAEDLTQEACQRAYSAYEQFEKKNAKAWLLTIVRHTYLNHVQKEKNRGEVIYLDHIYHDSKVPEILTQTETPEQQLLKSSEAELLHKTIQQLPDDFREIIILRELEELSYNEIATILDCAIGTVMSRLSRAREKLKEHLDDNVLNKESMS